MKKICCIALTIAAALLLQALVCPKYVETNREGALIREYYENAGNNDVVFIGDCEVYENFSPVKLWEDWGIPSVIRGSPQQLMSQSCLLLEEIFRYEKPRAVVLNVLAMKYDTPESTGRPEHREAYNRMTLDGMRWGREKWEAINASITPEERKQGGILTYLFPLLRFHDRWDQLTGEDLRCLFRKEAVSDSGYLMQTGVKPVTGEFVEPPLTDPAFGQHSMYWLNRIRQDCEDAGAQLILVKAPSLSPLWYPEWEAQMEDYAGQYGLKYYNFLEMQEPIGLDWSEDTYDGGLHLNVSGAEKLTVFFGRLLREDLELPDRRKEPELAKIWAEKTEVYESRKQNGV